MGFLLKAVNYVPYTKLRFIYVLGNNIIKTVRNENRNGKKEFSPYAIAKERYLHQNIGTHLREYKYPLALTILYLTVTLLTTLGK